MRLGGLDSMAVFMVFSLAEIDVGNEEEGVAVQAVKTSMLPNKDRSHVRGGAFCITLA